MKVFFAQNLKILSPPDESQASVYLETLLQAVRDRDLDDLAEFLTRDKKSQPCRFLAAVMALSPFLCEILMSNPHFIDPLRSHDIAHMLDIIIEQFAKLDEMPEINENMLMTHMRRLKKQAHLLIALGDLSGLFDVAKTTHILSRLAEAALGCALRFLLRQAHEQGKLALPWPFSPETGCGLVILGLGKLGAFELNYSSDIDLIAFIDETAPAIIDRPDYVDIFSRLMRRLARIMQERHAEGYVFRVDLRLRPDPASTPLALPFDAALHYYESRGQNWERAALIKARVVAGDRPAGAKLLKELEPYIWRKYLDYAAIADIVAIKQQIHGTDRLTGVMRPYGANVKLGRGGIREIEFFVQIQQLIAGGRLPQLRGRATVTMLDALCDLGWITVSTRDELSEAYNFLRQTEHRIQMVGDEQSHILPESEHEFLIIARLMGYQDCKSFTVRLKQIMQQVEGHYDALFAEDAREEENVMALNFTGEEEDPQTLATLENLGFVRVHDIYRIIRSWHSGTYRATHSTQARIRLQKLIPLLLQTISLRKRADETLLQFDAFLRGLPAGVQLFSLLLSNNRLLDMLMLIMSSAPRLADIITRKPHVFDGMLDPALFSELPDRSLLEQRLHLFLGQTTNYEEILDRLRIFAAEQRFLIGLRRLGASISGARTGIAFSDLADLMIEKALATVRTEFIARHGEVEGGKIAILGLGKLGSREVRAGSDVDLILLYEHDEAFEMSDGAKPLYVSQYYARLTQRLIAALSAPTTEGILYQVDMRLRPSGNKGPVAVAFSAFSRYQRHDAWIWEHMALTRARIVAGDQELGTKITADIDAILAGSPRHDALVNEVASMRQRIAAEKPAVSIWDLKHKAGGIIDLEFIAQYAVLAAYVPYRTGQTMGEILSCLPEMLCAPDERHTLQQIFTLYTDLNQTVSLCLNTDFDKKQASPGLIDLALATAGQPDLDSLEIMLQSNAACVQTIFTRLFPVG